MFVLKCNNFLFVISLLAVDGNKSSVYINGKLTSLFLVYTKIGGAVMKSKL